MELAVPANDIIIFKESETRDEYLNLARELKTIEHEVDDGNIYYWYMWNNPQRINNGTKRLRNQKTSGDLPIYSIVEIGQNTEKSPGNKKRHAITQTPVKDHQLTLVGNTLKELL